MAGEPRARGVERSVADADAARAAYEALPDISIDYAVMEKAAGVRPCRSRGWSDVGTWRSVRELRGASRRDGNLDPRRTSPVLAPGVRDTAIVVGAEGVLVLPFEREGELRAAVERLRREGREPTHGQMRTRLA